MQVVGGDLPGDFTATERNGPQFLPDGTVRVTTVTGYGTEEEPFVVVNSIVSVAASPSIAV
jgi:hypothetical protein